MNRKEEISRRNFFGVTASAGVGALVLGNSPARAAESGTANSDKKAPRELPAIAQVRFLADKFVQWQNSEGRLDPKRIPAAITDRKLFVLCYISSAMYRAWEATGDPSYKTAADRYWGFYLTATRDRTGFTAARAGIGLIPCQDSRRHHPRQTEWDDEAKALYGTLLEYRWDRGSCFRNGYVSPNSRKMDAANSDDNAAIGCGLMSYHAVTKRPDVLAHAEALAGYFLRDCVPMTYQGVWSPANGSWVVAPTDNAHFEHFHARAYEVSWGWTSIEAILYLTQLSRVTKSADIKQGSRQKCVRSMKWQFDACQFEDGACGMSGRDDKWMGMTAGAILSYLRVREAGFLAEDDTAYRTKALAAKDWMLAHLDEECLQRGGYWKISGKSQPRPKCNLAWLFGWTLEALTQIHRI